MKTLKRIASAIMLALAVCVSITAQEEPAKENQPAKPDKPQSAEKAKKAEKTAADEGKKTAAPAEVSTNALPEHIKINHNAIGAKVTVSSTHTGIVGEASAEALVDGDLGTRWSSEYSAPQEITLDLGKLMKLDKIIMHWEAAFATKYRVMVSQDGQDWPIDRAHFFFRMGEKKDVRKDEINMKAAPARYVRIDLDERVNKEWGFSLYEIEVQASGKEGEAK